MKKIKILHIYKSFYPETVGGIEKFIDTLNNELSHICDFGLVCMGNKTETYFYKKMKVYKFKKNFEISSCPFSISAFLKFRNISSQYDILHYHYPYPFMDFLNFFSLNKIKLTTYHSDIIKQKFINFFYSPLKYFFLKNQNLIVVSSKKYLNTSSTLQVFKNKLKVINFGIKKISSPKNNKIKKKGYILFIGSLRYYKGLDVLLEAAKKINSKIYICGSGSEYKDLLIKKKKLQLKNVFFLGRVSDKEKYRLLKNCNFFVFPSNSRSEAFGIAILEAMSFAKPIISCEVGSATSYLNINNKTGFVVKPNNPNELRDKINYLLDPKNKKIKKIFSVNSYNRFKKYFTSTTMCKSYLKLYEKLSLKSKNFL